MANERRWSCAVLQVDSMRFETVSVGRIDVESPGFDKFLFTFRRDTDALAESIAQVGVIAPVVLRHDGAALRIVCGYSRAMAMRRLSLGEMPACVFEADELSDVQAMLLSLHDNAWSRGFNPIEAGMALSKFRAAGYSEDEVVNRIAPVVGVTPSPVTVARYVSLLRLPEEAKIALCAEDIELPQAFLLAELGEQEASAAFQALFVRCKLNINEAKEVVQHLSDLVQQLGMTMAGLLQKPEATAVLGGSGMNKVQRGNALRRLVRSWRFPVLTEQERRASALCRALSNVPGLHVTHPPCFEDDHVKVSLQASSPQQLKGQLNALEAGLADGTFGKLFSVINE